MSATPRVFIVRHGETEWSLDGRHTSTSDIPLTANGERRVRATGKALVGHDRLIVPRKLAHILACPAEVEVTGAVREWDYGDYEGLTSAAIRKGGPKLESKAGGISGRMDVRVASTSAADVTDRLDQIIEDIRQRWHRPAFEDSSLNGDVLVVAHGHILRAFAMRWARKGLDEGLTFLLEAGGVGTLSYEHHNIDEPAILLGGAFVVDLENEVDVVYKE
ncbi:unnamed protein product [Parascedosporium putredinis]|uniref:Phosphoglycerate mutase n=1 Tax=Parascedosporium putredinis TaxID=1442378 RepID=A0A9P1H8Z8_9PEZI|nr:unnamed protein product [Parascedosporium putredinis]CAI8001378.1 unnamed protein product [Parascedosporium putredinis]